VNGYKSESYLGKGAVTTDGFCCYFRLEGWGMILTDVAHEILQSMNHDISWFIRLLFYIKLTPGKGGPLILSR
jgi:hypothetical protein